MSRIYAIEPTPTLIGVAADHRMIAAPDEMVRAMSIMGDLVLRGAPAPSGAPPWVVNAVEDMKAHRGRVFIHVGPDLPAELHSLAHAVNEALGGRGHTFDVIEPVEAAPVDQATSFHELLQDMRAGRVTSLIIIDANPVYSASGLGFAEALHRVAFSLTTAIGPNETAAASRWSLPQRHPFEDWSDARAFDGTATILQPQALPLYDGISPHHLLALMLDFATPGPLAIVRQTWQKRGSDWHASLANGVVADTSAPRIDVALRPEAARGVKDAPPSQQLRLLLRPDPHIWDGRFNNNAWLQELPRPLTKLTWDNPLLISPAQGRRLGVGNGDRVNVSAGRRGATLPVWIVPGQADNCIVGLLGFGRAVTGAVGEGTGFNLYPLAFQRGPVTLRKAGG